jgi:hypothetical protein
MRSLLQACLVLILSVSWLPQCHAEYQNLAEAICYFGDSALIRRVWSNANNEAIQRGIKCTVTEIEFSVEPKLKSHRNP